MNVKFIKLLKIKKNIWYFSLFMTFISLIGILFSSFYEPIKKPVNLGMDFIGGNEIRIERLCNENCSEITTDILLKKIRDISIDKALINSIRLQIQNDNKLISIRTPFIKINKSEELIENLNKVIGPLDFETVNSRSIGPKLGKDLLINGLISLAISLIAISLYLSIRFDKKFSILALTALFHDLFIVFGIFSWLGIILSVEVNSLFAVALLTIAGYSVNDTVVIFDRIRENTKSLKYSNLNESVEVSVNESLRRTLFTSFTTLIPLLTLIIFGSYSLYWFSIALALGIIVGSYSSILLAPSFLIEESK